MFARESSTVITKTEGSPANPHKKWIVIESRFGIGDIEIRDGDPLSREAVFALASGSPRRKQLIRLVGREFKIVPANIDESPNDDEAPEAYVSRIAKAKARSASAGTSGVDWVIAADTTVAKDNAILGKPTDAEEARQMLTTLRGKEHQVYTGIAVLRTSDGQMTTDLAKTDVPMRAYSDDEIESYIKTGDPMDKAGSYAIQHPLFRPVEKLEGCYANVVGLPLCHLTRTLKKLGIALEADVPTACQETLGYDCPVYESVLEGIS